MSTKNYSFNFNEDIFIKHFFFMFFMYNISNNKCFIPMYFRREKNRQKYVKTAWYNVSDTTVGHLFKRVNSAPKNKYFMSKIFIAKYINWIFVYFLIYSITNLRVKIFNKKSKLKQTNYQLLYQTFYFSRQNYLMNN